MGLAPFSLLLLLLLIVCTPIRAQVLWQKPVIFQANATEHCESACTALVAALGEYVYYKEVPASVLKDLFTAQQREVVPACLVQPRSAEDVAVAIKIIKANECIFAIKSGGHACFPGASNAPGGITLDLRYLNELSVSDDRSTAFVGPGNRWGEVYDFLDPLNITVVGGRVSDVGVGGLLLGGGISFASRKYGWGLDNVKNYEVVLPNGSMSSISQATHPDLYWALRGGGSNFGVVTRFDLETYPQALMWGGFSGVLFSGTRERLASLGLPRSFRWSRVWFVERFFDSLVNIACRIGYCTTLESFATLLEDLVKESEEDTYAQGYGCLVKLPFTNTWVVGAQISHGQALQNAPAFRKVLKLPSIYSTNRIATNTDLTKELAKFNPRGMRATYATLSFKMNAELIVKLWEIVLSEIESIKHVRGFIPTAVVQTISKAEISHFSKNGGNALGISEADGPLILFSLPLSWTWAGDDDAVMKASRNTIDRATAIGKEMGLYHRYIYQNYAAKHQDVFEGYSPENRKRLREIQKMHDPEEVMARLQPGYFKI